MSCVNIRGCRIGEGRPKVILPIVERTEAAILEKAAQFSTLLADCVEWRADWFEGFQSPAAIARCVQKLRVVLRDKLLLVTFRTKAEGGEQALSHPEYLAFLSLILDTDCAVLLDIEFFSAGKRLPQWIAQAGGAGTFRRGRGGLFQPRFCQDPAPGRACFPHGTDAADRSRSAQAGRNAPVPQRCAGAADRHR